MVQSRGRGGRTMEEGGGMGEGREETDERHRRPFEAGWRAGGRSSGPAGPPARRSRRSPPTWSFPSRPLCRLQGGYILFCWHSTARRNSSAAACSALDVNVKREGRRGEGRPSTHVAASRCGLLRPLRLASSSSTPENWPAGPRARLKIGSIAGPLSASLQALEGLSRAMPADHEMRAVRGR
jgi:hypothetical protein